MPIQNDLERLAQNIPIVPEERNYWMIRTVGGDYYEHFKKGGYVGIGYNYISVKDLESLEVLKNEKSLKERVVKNEKGNQRPGLAISQLKRFTFEIQKDDVVIIPDESLNKLSIGVVVEDSLSFSSDYPKDVCPFEKRRKIEWKKEIPKRKIHPVLYKLFFAHQTIVSANGYDKFIDKSMHDFFRKGSAYHLVLDVKTEKDINALGFFSFGGELLNFADELSSELGVKASIEKSNFKSTVESPGLFEIIAYTMAGAFFLGIATVAIVGGKVRVKNWVGEIDFETTGFWDKIEKLIDKKKLNEKKEVTDFIKNSRIEVPEEFLELENQGKEKVSKDESKIKSDKN